MVSRAVEMGDQPETGSDPVRLHAAQDGRIRCLPQTQAADKSRFDVDGQERRNRQVLGLELGADDYITKPFSVREVLPGLKRNCAGSVSQRSVAKTIPGS